MRSAFVRYMSRGWLFSLATVLFALIGATEGNAASIGSPTLAFFAAAQDSADSCYGASIPPNDADTIADACDNCWRHDNNDQADDGRWGWSWKRV